MSWVSLRVEPGVARDGVLAALFEAGAQGVHEDGSALVTHFPDASDIESICAAVMTVDPAARCVVSETPITDWSEAWKARIGAHELGALVVAPPWLAHDADPSTTIVIEPAMAFGTGEHATTRGVVRLMQGLVRPGDVVVDLGAGSAVLAIAAAKLGAARVTAVELDADAIGNAMENVARNGVIDRVHVIEGDAAALLPLLAPVDVVLANIISSVLIELLPAIYTALTGDGRVVLSGILVEERDAMREALTDGGWVVTAEDREDVWWSVAITRR